MSADKAIIRILIFILWVPYTCISQQQTLRTEIEKIIWHDTSISYKETPGFIIAVILPDTHYILPFGSVSQQDTQPLHASDIFEIGGLSKVFTAELVDQLVSKNQLAYTTPVNQLLPISLINPGLDELILLDLINHRSSFPKAISAMGAVETEADQPFENFSKKQILDYYHQFNPKAIYQNNFLYAPYNYALIDSTYRGDKWCYNIVYYPRRKNELTFKGDFWVNDTTWAIKEINMQATKSANLNWVRDVYIEQEYDVLNDSTFLITRDYFMSDFSFRDKEEARGIYGKRTTLYDNYKFDIPKPKEFYKSQVDPYQYEVYNRPDDFWEQNRLEKLNGDEQSVYKMLDTLKTVPRFKALYSIGSILASGYYEVDNFDVGPVFSIFGFNEAEGFRVRLGGRTYFGQNDPWRLEGFGAYGFRDQRLKYGLSGKFLLDRKSRLTAYGGFRKDVEQTGASLTSTTDVLGRNLASSSLVTVGANDRLTRIKLGTVGFSIEPAKNFNIRLTGSYRVLRTATETFSINYLKEDGTIGDDVHQPEVELGFFYTPKRKTTGYGVERTTINSGDFASIYLGYTKGLKDVLGGDFDYQRIQGLYTQPWNIGGIGRLTTTVEAGKTFGDVNISLLNPIPGNQTLFSIYNTFSQLDFYEFVSDEYVSVHFQHNFGGRIFQRIPWIRDLNLREVIGFRTVIGNISQSNIDLNRSNIVYQAPTQPYYEYSIGIGNIFKVFRIDFNVRGNYLNEVTHPDARKYGVTGSFGFDF